MWARALFYCRTFAVYDRVTFGKQVEGGNSAAVDKRRMRLAGGREHGQDHGGLLQNGTVYDTHKPLRPTKVTETSCVDFESGR